MIEKLVAELQTGTLDAIEIERLVIQGDTTFVARAELADIGIRVSREAENAHQAVQLVWNQLEEKYLDRDEDDETVISTWVFWDQGKLAECRFSALSVDAARAQAKAMMANDGAAYYALIEYADGRREWVDYVQDQVTEIDPMAPDWRKLAEDAEGEPERYNGEAPAVQ